MLPVLSRTTAKFTSPLSDRRAFCRRRRFGSARVGAFFTLAFALQSAVLAVVSTYGSEAHGSVSTDQAKIKALEQRIEAQGNKAQQLVTQYNQVETHMLAIQRQIASARARLVTDAKAQSKATVNVRQWAIDAYINAVSGNATGLSTLTGTADATTLSEQQTYLGVASGSLDTAVAILQSDERRTAATQATLHNAEVATAATLRQLSAARGVADAAINASQKSLDAVHGNLLTLVTKAKVARERAEAIRQEKELAARQQQAASQQQAAAPTDSIPVAPTSGSYANPLRSIGGLRSERIDQGVDFSGFGPIYAIGSGIVISTVNGGWPGGTFISYKLTNGPAAGLVVYAAEDISARVQVGQSVTSSTVLGTVYEGSAGIEIGWCDASGNGTTMASDFGQYYGSNSTAFGYNFSQLLHSVGAPGGILQSSSPTGSLPNGWPRW